MHADCVFRIAPMKKYTARNIFQRWRSNYPTINLADPDLESLVVDTEADGSELAKRKMAFLQGRICEVSELLPPLPPASRIFCMNSVHLCVLLLVYFLCLSCFSVCVFFLCTFLSVFSVAVSVCGCLFVCVCMCLCLYLSIVYVCGRSRTFVIKCMISSQRDMLTEERDNKTERDRAWGTKIKFGDAIQVASLQKSVSA